MKILVISKKAHSSESRWKFDALSHRQGVQVRVLAPRFIQDFLEGFKFYPDIIWIDEEPYRWSVMKWILLKRFFMPWSHVVSSANENFFRQFSGVHRAIERFNYRNLSAVLSGGKTVSDNLLRKEFTGKLMEISGLDFIHPLPEPQEQIDPANLKGSLGLQFKTIGYFGPLRPEKGLDWLIRSIAKIPLNLCLLFVGTGPSEFPLKQLAFQLGLDSRLKIVPDSDSSDFAKYYRAMDVLVLPALLTNGWREPFNEVILEAMKVGLPVIASKSGEIPYEVGEGGILIPEGDEPALAEALTKILKEDAFRTQMVEKAKVQVQEFAPEKLIDSLAQFFSTILK